MFGQPKNAHNIVVCTMVLLAVGLLSPGCAPTGLTGLNAGEPPASPAATDAPTLVPTPIEPTSTAIATTAPTRTRTPIEPTRPPAATPTKAHVLVTPSTQPSGDAVLVGAGDMRDCNAGLEQTAALIDKIPGTVAVLGDLTLTGVASEYPCYDKAWGRFKDRSLPVVGNHEYQGPNPGKGFGEYWGAVAHGPGYYYSVELGSWHVVVLNSECGQAGGCQAGSTQERWLKADLAAHPNQCILAMWHEPRFNSGTHGNNTAIQSFWNDLYAAHASLILNGHEHNYERFARQNPNGQADSAGIREFIVGTGGAGGGSWAKPLPNSEVHAVSAIGAIKLTLHAKGYDWQFVPTGSTTFTDSGSDSCP